MHELSGASARQLAVPPTTGQALSNSSGAGGGGQGGQDETPRSAPRFNLPDSYWAQTPSLLTRDVPEPGVSRLIAARLSASNADSHFAKLFERMDEDRENDPRSRDQSAVLVAQALMRPVQLPDITLSPETLGKVIALIDPDGTEPHLDSSTSSTATSAASGVQQDSASGCCIPPSCTIL